MNKKKSKTPHKIFTLRKGFQSFEKKEYDKANNRGTKTPMWPFVQKPSATPKAVPITYRSWWVDQYPATCHTEMATQAVRIASIRTSFKANKKEADVAYTSAATIPAERLINKTPDRYTAQIPIRDKTSEGNL